MATEIAPNQVESVVAPVEENSKAQDVAINPAEDKMDVKDSTPIASKKRKAAAEKGAEETMEQTDGEKQESAAEGVAEKETEKSPEKIQKIQTEESEKEEKLATPMEKEQQDE
jgi:hypothetical protein